MPLAYCRDPEEITRRSFATIEAEAGLGRMPEGLRGLAARLVHACGMVDILADLAWAGDPAAAGRDALAEGGAVLVDARMVEAGVTRRRLPSNAALRCFLEDQRVPALVAELGTTRSAAAVELWRPHLDGAVVAIGNAPTALFHLLERMAVWPERPAVILAFPVGFVGAVESKQALVEAGLGVPFLTLRGRRGGSALAAAAVNALLAGEPPREAPP